MLAQGEVHTERGLTEPAALQGLNRLDVMQRAHGSQEVFIMER
jgi:hypothetical protein